MHVCTLTESVPEQQQQQQDLSGSERWMEADPLAEIETLFDEQVYIKIQM